jgi:hypothetical protein
MTPEQVPASYVTQVAKVESGGNPNARAATSSAGGLFQFVTPTWEGLRREHPELGLTKNGRFDPAQAEKAFRVFTAKNAQAYRRAMGREPSLSELYLAHFLGSGTAVAACTAAPGTLAANILGPAAVRANPFLRGMTCGQLREWARRKVPDMLPVTPVLPPAGRGPAKRMTSADDLNDEQLRRLRGEGEPPKV